MQWYIVKCLHTASRDECYYRSNERWSLSHTAIKNYKVKIHGGNCVNIISTLVVEKISLKSESLLQQYTVTWSMRAFILLSNIILCVFSFQVIMIIFSMIFCIWILCISC